MKKPVFPLWRKLKNARKLVEAQVPGLYYPVRHHSRWTCVCCSIHYTSMRADPHNSSIPFKHLDVPAIYRSTSPSARTDRTRTTVRARPARRMTCPGSTPHTRHTGIPTKLCQQPMKGEGFQHIQQATSRARLDGYTEPRSTSTDTFASRMAKRRRSTQSMA